MGGNDKNGPDYVVATDEVAAADDPRAVDTRDTGRLAAILGADGSVLLMDARNPLELVVVAMAARVRRAVK